MGPFDLLLVALASARLTRLTTRDTVTEPARKWVLLRLTFTAAQRRAVAEHRQLPPPPRPRIARARLWLVELLGCPWCVGVWWCFAVATAAWFWNDHPGFLIPAMALGASYLVGFVAVLEPSPDIDDADDGDGEPVSRDQTALAGPLPSFP
jgi:hypothetical protein